MAKRHTEEARAWWRTHSITDETVAALIEQVEARTWERAAKVCVERMNEHDKHDGKGARRDAAEAFDCASAIRAAAKEE